ncbi:thiamine pyrophosphate-binding protein [Polymorphum gilvum]|uniref:Acetolactate synthase, catabolic, putative n=1 Tax=Polymorphum gilvum (strain LMG 25793 / CGMCC 1.9160 / SL003B-26A1) TaxID=991905 RepID=F2J6V3_POLGS|nr:thiamine pyrophosphate-binding protein [Polymorphum gilvum]ADZ72586.1 Acetolactate synthase, catabolic, putative [Polymorphum gilvum SL003B-26A1]
MTTGADLIAKKLHAAGCRHAFGIPGGEVLALMDALDRAGLAFALVKHENAGGFMAEGTWHATGAPGVLLATLGPGVANAVNVVANAFQDRVPLIFLTGCVDAAEAETYTHQVFDHQQLLRPIVKASFRAAPGALAAMMDKAIALAQSGQPGPVHVDVPIGVAESEAAEPIRPAPTVAPIPQTQPCGRELAAARALFAGARRPIAIAGVDAVNEDAGAAISAFCRRHGVPLVTTYKGKGLMDEADPLALGGAGLSPKADAILLPLIRQSDCILLVGYDPIEMRINWRNPWPADAPVVEVTPVLRTHGMHAVRHTLAGGVAASLALLSEARGPANAWPDGAPGVARAALQEAFSAEPSGWGPATVIHTLRAALPEATVATADSGAHRILASQIWRCAAPRGMLQSSALCTMACALPLAMGHRLAQSQAPVVVFVGDAGLEMGLGELATLRDLKLPVIVCVLVDSSLALIELKQRSTQRPNVGVDFGETDFPALARGFGGHGVWIEDRDTLAREAEAALARDSFTLLACRIPRRAYDGLI